jgi:hypothetical protein
MNFRIPKPVSLKRGTYILAPKPISTTYFINCCNHSVCLHRYVARQRLGEHIPAATNTQQYKIVECVVFYAVHVVSNDNLWVCLFIPLPLLGNGSVNTFQRQRRIVRGVVFYKVRVV